MNSLKTAHYWMLSLLLSLLAVTVIGQQWGQTKRDYGHGTHIVRNESQLKELVRHGDTIEFNGKHAPYLIPTGFFIQSMAFVTTSDVNITGYIWQRYPKEYPANFIKGFIFPEEVDSDNTTIRQQYHEQGKYNGKTYDLIGWYFDVTVRQSFDYSDYPLDYLTVWLRLWAKDFDHDESILFVPDFSAYQDTAKATFGLDQDIVPGEWDIDETFFSYDDTPYDTNFGYSNSPTSATYKEFFFNIGARRKFINAFVINLVPLFVVAILLFASLMTISGDSEHAERFGFNTSGILAACSALFFVVLLAHIQVRSQFSDSGLVYIEYFYLVMYIFLLLTALNAYLFSLKQLNSCSLLHFRDNLLPKVIFWPLLLWSMAFITILRL